MDASPYGASTFSGGQAIGPLFQFQTPYVYDIPTYLPDSKGIQVLLWRHYKRRARGVNVFVLSDNTVVQDTPTPAEFTYGAIIGIAVTAGSSIGTYTNSNGVLTLEIGASITNASGTVPANTSVASVSSPVLVSGVYTWTITMTAAATSSGTVNTLADIFAAPAMNSTNVPLPWIINDPLNEYSYVTNWDGTIERTYLDPHISFVYEGGHVHTINQFEADFLGSAGYSSWITPL
jgi:hypothetical protein